MHTHFAPFFLSRVAVAGLVALTFFAAPAAHADRADPWDGNLHSTISVYGWLPGITGQTRFRVPDGSVVQNDSDSDIFSKLSGAFMLSGDIRKGNWGIYGDIDWVKFSDRKGRVVSIGGERIGANGSLDTNWNAKGGMVTLAGIYTLGHGDQGYVDLLVGARYLWLKGNVSWDFGLAGNGGRLDIADSGHVHGQTHVTDGIVGVRGQWTPFPSHRIFIPYYFDIGTGDSDHTEQYALGIGYAFHWGDIALNYRDVEYHENSDAKFIRKVRLSGPSFNISWHF